MALATDETITLPIPNEVAEAFLRDEIRLMPDKRPLRPLRFGEHGDFDLGMWRIDHISSQMHNGYPRMIAVLRKVWP
jgi:hypothetical protein